MILHITPKIWVPFDLQADVSIVDCRVTTSAGMALVLIGGTDIVARRPYPNKNYLVVCRKRGNAAISGILIDCDSAPEFSMTTRWSTPHGITSHAVQYRVCDSDFGLASDNMSLWSARSQFSDRWPEQHKAYSPLQATPCMDLFAGARPKTEIGRAVDVLNDSNWIIERNDVFVIPTIEQARLTSMSHGIRMPKIEDAFKPVQIRTSSPELAASEA